MSPKQFPFLALILGVMLVSCGAMSSLPESAGIGPQPALPVPQRSLLPVVNIAPARGWSEGQRPQAAPNLRVQAFARDLKHPRWLFVLPNGDVLVAETNAPPREGGGLKAWVAGLVMKRAGAGVPSANQIRLLRDADGDGEAEFRSVFLQNLHSPFGMALVGDRLFVANTDAILSFPYQTGQTEMQARGTVIVRLPAGPFNYHWTKSLIASPDGRRLYVGVGSDSNIGERGLEQETGRAAIWEVDVATGEARIFAAGMRNPVGLAWEPETQALWAAVNERDELGNDLVPDFLTRVRKGDFYGWPYSYFGSHVDMRVQPQRPELVAQARVPDYALGAHTASLGLCTAEGAHLPPPFTNGMFVGQHGSWNRKPLSGYKVIFVPFQNGMPQDLPQDVLTGFVDAEGRALGRPVGVVIDRSGALLVADDVGNTIWRVSAAD